MATLIAKGRNVEVLNLTLSSTDDIQIGFVNQVNAVLIKARTAVDIQVRSTRGAPSYFTIPSGSTLTLDLVDATTASNSAIQATNLWIRSVSATPVVEVLGFYGG